MAMKSDGTVYVNTLIDTKGFGKGVNTMQKQIGGFSGAIGKLGAVIAATFAVGKLIQFGKEAIDLGSDLQEVQNVVDVTFSSMSDQVNEFAEGAAEAAGLSETMFKKYVGTFGAMAKAFGFAENEAFGMSTSLTQLAGDVASFYNITQDEAFTKLKSVFTGETESLKDLGVVMTQTALDSFAMAEGYGKTTKQMNEQEKVALRYAFVLAQLSAAQGDFTRTSDGWANQTRILNLNFDSFKANIGQALINIFTPFLKIINQIVSKMAELSARFVAFSEMITGRGSSGGDSPGKALSEITSGYKEVTESTKEATKAQQKYLNALDELNVISAGTSDGTSVNSGTSTKFDEGIIPQNSINEEVTLFDKLLDKMDLLRTIGSDLYNLFTRPLIANKDGFLLAAENISNALNGTLETLSNTFKKTVEYAKNVYDEKVSPIVQDLTKDFEALTANFLKWFNADMTPVLDRWGEKLDELFDAHVMVFVERTIERVATLASFFSATWDVIYSVIQYAIDFIFPIIADYIESFGMRIMNLLTIFADVAAGIQAILSGIVDFVVGAFTGNWEKALAGVENIFIGVFNSIASVVVNFCNSLSDIINTFIGAINNIGLKSGLFEVLGFGGINEIPMIPSFQVPYLATGAVIPPNAPFMAMLGDQRNGRNLEAPEELIRQIVREESGISSEMMSLLTEIARNTRETADKDLVIGDRAIAQANKRGIRSMGYSLLTEG